MLAIFLSKWYIGATDRRFGHAQVFHERKKTIANMSSDIGIVGGFKIRTEKLATQMFSMSALTTTRNVGFVEGI